MIKAFQLRVARSTTGIGVRELALYLGVSRTIISKWEKQEPFEELKTKRVSEQSLVFFFKQHHILFPTPDSISIDIKPQNQTNQHLTRFQLRGARAALGLTQQKLAELTNYSIATINYLETQDNDTFLNETNKIIDDMELRVFFERKNIKFPNPVTIEMSS